MTEREYVEMPIACLICGYTKRHPVKAEKGLPMVDTCLCPKCSNNAYVLNPLRISHVIAAMTKEIVSLKLDIMDLQGASDHD